MLCREKRRPENEALLFGTVERLRRRWMSVVSVLLYSSLPSATWTFSTSQPEIRVRCLDSDLAHRTNYHILSIYGRFLCQDSTLVRFLCLSALSQTPFAAYS